MRRNPMDAALIQPFGSRSSHLERHGQQVLSNSCSKSLSGSTEVQAFRSKGQEEKRGKSGEDPCIFEEPVEKWRDQEKGKEEKWKKRKKMKKESEGEAQKKEMVEKVQRVHHKSVCDESEDRQRGEGKQKN